MTTRPIPTNDLAPTDLTLETAARLLDAIEAQRPLKKGEAGEILRAARMWPAGGGRIEGRVTIKKGGQDDCAF